MAQINDYLIEMNPWWKGGLELEYKDREIYNKIIKFMGLKQIITLTGLRRVGKTTLMMKIIKDAIKSGTSKNNILYFSFDEFKNATIKNILDEYSKTMQIDIKSGKYLILLDEIQKLENWEEQLKTIYDLYNKNIKIIISGSESLFIKKKSKETLAGRLFEFKVNNLTFKEYVNFKEEKIDNVKLYSKELEKLFDTFIKTLGFPELTEITDYEIIKKYIKESIIDKIIYKDIPTLIKIKDITILERILNTITENPGQIIEINSYSKELNISRQSLSNYLHYLESAYLIKKLYNFSKNKRKTERKLKKYYPVLVLPQLLFSNDNLVKSKVFETIIVNQLGAEFFWRDQYKNEVDIILADGQIKPIEIKYGNIDTKGVITFMEKYKIKEGFIITKDKEDIITTDNKKIILIPAYKYLYKLKSN